MRGGLIALFAATFLELCGLFMYGPLLLFTLKARGLEEAWIGLFGAVQWLGMALATPFTAGWVRRLGARRALLLAAAVPLVAYAGINLSDAVPLWALLYLIAGMAGALRWIVAEAMVAELAPPERRGRIVGLFETMVGLTFVVGPAWRRAGSAGWLAVGLLAAALLLSLRVPALHSHLEDDGARPGLSGILDALRAAPAVMAAGLIGGFFEAGLSSVLPLYGLAIGLGAALAALLVSASGLGSAVMMVPVGELVDRFGRQAVWKLCALVNLAATLLLPWVGEAGALAWLIALLWGGAGGGLYTVAMIDIGHRHQGVALVSATAVLVMSYTLGGMMAPALGGMALQWSPQTGFPLLLAAWALAGVLAITLMPDRGPRPPRPARSATSD
ncbi:MAG: MFS transporter [Sphaerotilus sulfidivorans]|uniref:MFS transporter n=1 Tax=Sphaerotilus sulfidivorans TaxID=639200 RepID=UPI003F312C60